MDRESKLKPCRKSQYVSDRMKVARAVPAAQFARAPANRAGGHSQENPLESYSCNGRVAQLREHLLCKHTFISPKSASFDRSKFWTPQRVSPLPYIRKKPGSSYRVTTGLTFRVLHRMSGTPLFQHSNLAFRSDNKTPRPLADVVLLKHFFDQLN